MMALGILIQPQTIPATLLCLASLAVIYRYLTRHSALPLPPGPYKDNFFLGNSIPTDLYDLFNLPSYSMLALTREFHG